MSFASPKNLIKNLNPVNVLKNPVKALAPPGVKAVSSLVSKAGLPDPVNLLNRGAKGAQSAISGGRL